MENCNSLCPIWSIYREYCAAHRDKGKFTESKGEIRKDKSGTMSDNENPPRETMDALKMPHK